MYAKEYMKNVTKETVQKEIHFMVSSGAYYSFFINKCPKCGKSVVSLHVDYTTEGSFAYFFCGHCGKKVKKRAFVFSFEKEAHQKAHYAMKQYSVYCFTFRHSKDKEIYRGLKLSDSKMLMVLPDKNKVVSMDDIRIVEYDLYREYKKRQRSQ